MGEGSPTAAQSLHHLLDESGLRLAVPLPTNLLAAQPGITRTSQATRKMGIGVLELSMSGRGWGRGFQAPLWRLGGTPPALCRSRVLPAPALLAGEGGGGCAAFKRSAVTPGRWLLRSWLP